MTGIENMSKFLGEKTGLVSFIKSISSLEHDVITRSCVEQMTENIYRVIDEKYGEIFCVGEPSQENILGCLRIFRGYELPFYLTKPWPLYRVGGVAFTEVETQFMDEIWDEFLEAYKEDRGKDETYEKFLSHAGEKSSASFNPEKNEFTPEQIDRVGRLGMVHLPIAVSEMPENI